MNKNLKSNKNATIFKQTMAFASDFKKTNQAISVIYADKVSERYNTYHSLIVKVIIFVPVDGLPVPKHVRKLNVGRMLTHERPKSGEAGSM